MSVGYFKTPYKTDTSYNFWDNSSAINFNIS